MTDLLRKSGIEIVGDVPWGTHLCQFYKTRDDLLDLLVPYFKAGLESNELCIWVASDPLRVEDAENALREAVFDYDTLKSRGRIEIAPHAEWYMRDGCFDFQAVLEGWAGRLEGALEQGLEGLRAAGNTAGLEEASWASFAEYEEVLEEMIGGYRMLAVCTYSLDRCSASDVIEVLKSHQYALAGREGEWELIESSGRGKALEAPMQSEGVDGNNRVNRDVTSRKRAEKSLRSMSEELIRVNTELDGYARAVSHELRGPLAAAALANELLKDELSNPDLEDLREEVEGSTEVIQRNIGKCYDLIDNLLALAEAGQGPVRVMEVEVTGVVRGILREQDSQLRDRGFEVRVDDDLGSIHANETQMYQLFSNLVVNAIRHNDSSEPTVEIRYLGDLESGGHRYIVKDNGSGIPVQHTEEAFRPFFKRGKGADTGIGLSIVRRIIEAYGGDIKAYNRDGACFEFVINDA
jgi:signal transduction histidine kinase